MVKKVIKLFAIVIVSVFVLLCSATNVEAADKIKVFLIEINPKLQTVPGKPKVSEFFQQDLNAAKNELIKDLEYSSHGNISIQVVSNQYLNEFPTYRGKVKLKNGSMAHRFDEATYLKYAGYSGGSKGNWYNLLTNNIFNATEAYSFDYDYIFKKYDLINKSNQNVFDQVWLLTIDPVFTYETIMVGRKPFWINAPGYQADCPNFQVINISISRRDANLHALGHGVEGTLNAVFSDDYQEWTGYNNKGTYRYYYPSYDSYKQNSVTINPKKYADLNYWEKFTLGTYSNTMNYGSVGNVHFPFNGKEGYDYTNTSKVYTNWKEWLNYPNITGKFVLDNNDSWKKNAGNNSLGSSENKDPDRLFMRFWFYLMPHIEGYTEDGYSNNWWQYFRTLDFVTKIKVDKKEYSGIKVGDDINLKYTLVYNSGKTETITNPNASYSNIQIKGDSVKKNGSKISAANMGESVVSVYYDGKHVDIKYKVDTKPDDPSPPSSDPPSSDPPSTTGEDPCAHTEGGDAASKALGGAHDVNCGNVEASTDLHGTVGAILNVVYGVIGTIALVMVVIGGVRYATSQGDPGRLKKAKDTILYGIIGLIIVLSAFAITYFVLDMMSK